MSARACQLCGKPLSRIRVGADGDFCSREHRNQYRLRQGMDRLQEANKVASVMRRRENLKPLSHGTTASSLAITHRESPQAKFTPAAQLALTGFRLAPHLGAPTIRGRAENLRPEAMTPASSKIASRLQPQALRPGRRRAPEMRPPLALKLAVRMRRAPMVPSRSGVSAPAVRRRECGMARSDGKRIVFAALTKGNSKAGHRALTQDQFRRSNPPSPSEGMALRVSCACRFRLPSRRVREMRIAAESAANFKWREKRHRIAPALKPGTTSTRAQSVAIRVEGLFCPPPPAQTGAGAFPRSRAVGVPKPPLRACGEGARRPFSIDFNPESFASMQLAAPEFCWMPHAEARPHRTITPPPVKGPRQSHYALAPFVPADLPSGYSFNISQNGTKDHRR